MRKLWIVLALAGVLPAVAETVYPFPKAKGALPNIDGEIQSGEWDSGTRFGGFLQGTPFAKLPPGYEGFATFLSDGKTLYVWFHTKAHNVDIGGGMKANASKHDGPVWADDAVELVVQGDDPARIAHFIINSKNIVFDRLGKSHSLADLKWNCEGMQVSGKVIHGWWDLEIAIPLSSIGKFERGILVNAAQSTPGGNAASLTASTDYLGGPKIRLEWNDRAPSVQLASIGNPAGGEWRPSVRINGGAPDAKYRVDVLLRKLKENGANDTVLLCEGKTIGAGELFACRYDTRLRTMLRQEVVVRDAVSGQRLMERCFDACRGVKSSGVPSTAEFDVGEVGEVAVFNYPGMNKVRFTFHPAPGKGITKVGCSLNGKRFFLEREAGAFSALVDAPKEPGSYPVQFAIKNADGVTKADWTLEKKSFEWEGNSIGKDKIVIPPFKPIVAKDAEAEVILRRYAFGPAGLPESVETLGRNILSDGAYYEIETGGKTVRFNGAKPRIKVNNGGHDADIIANALAGDITLKSRANMEYDGFIWSDIELSGLRDRSVDRFSLIIPLKDAEIPLMHICTTDSIRYNPTGAVPAGEGVVWDGTKLHRASGFSEDYFAPQVVPYVWLGAEKRGLCWFVNNTAGMKLDKDKPSVRIVRQQGVLRLEIDFINQSSRIQDGHSFHFGLEATPVKLADKSMRRHFQTGTGERPKGFIARMEINGNSGGFWNSWARRPYENDWKLFQLGCDCVTKGTKEIKDAYWAEYVASTNRHDAAMELYASKLPDIGKQTHFNWMQTCRDYSIRKIWKFEGTGFLFKYSDPTLNWYLEDDEEYYKSEWISRSTGYHGATRNFLTPSYLDHIVYYYAKEADFGMTGVYFDDMFPMTCRNPDTCMVKDDAGQWHGNFGILEMRELVKRTATMLYQRKANPTLIQIHMTNCLLTPAFAFGTSMLSWEDHFGSELFQKRFSVDYMRAESLGGQVGAEAVALDGLQPTGWDEKDWKARYFTFLTRTQQALLLPAGVKTWMRPARPYWGLDRKELFKILEVMGRFEIWTDDCEFQAFYENDGLVSGQPKDVLLGTYRKPGKVLAIFGDAGGKDVEFTIGVEAAKLGLKEPLVFTNGETGERLPDGKLKLPAWDLRLIEITEGK